MEMKKDWVARLLSRLRSMPAGRREPEAAAAGPLAASAAAPGETERECAEARARIHKVLSARHDGSRLARKEDARLVRGRGVFVDDYRPAGLLHMAVVRSPYAHAKILRIDTSAAESMPGVVCTLTGREITALCQPFLQIGEPPGASIEDYPLAVDKARYQGDPVAVVVADNVRLAQDAARLVDVDYDPLEPVMTAEQALGGKTLLHEQMGTNANWHGVYEYGDVDGAFAEARHVVKIDTLHFHRFGSTAIEPNAAVATWSPLGDIELFANITMATPLVVISMALGVPVDRIRLRTHDIGGGFGNRIGNYPYLTLAAIASRKAGGRPVKWVETRSEHMQAGTQGSERSYYDTEVALDENGVITAIRSRHVDDIGAYPRFEPLGAVIWSEVLPAAYKLRNMRIDFTQVVTNKGPSSANRGYSKLPHMWFMERVIDICGHSLGIPADEMRLRNYIEQFPYETPNGGVYDSGDLVAMLAKAKRLVGWDEWQRKKAEARRAGRLIGIGIGTTLDPGTNNHGQGIIVNPNAIFSGNAVPAVVKLDIDGSLHVTVGTFPQGQGHETSAAQVVAEEFGIDPAMVDVAIGFDTARNCYTALCGTYASQFAVTGLSAVHGATGLLKAQLKKLAAFALQAAEEELEFGLGEQGPEVRVQGTGRGIAFWALSNLANGNSASLPRELRDIDLNCRYTYRPPFETVDRDRKYGNFKLTYALQTHIGVIEVDPDTFRIEILDYAIIDDCGTVINPMIVKGQVFGGAAHGFGAALLENLAYDGNGNVLTGSFTDYAPITVNNMPELKYGEMQSPSPFTYNGAKGMGEGGGGPVHTISAALQDALWDLGLVVRQSHNSPMALFDARPELARERAVSVRHR